ncbi:MAG: hypothetical protein HGA25_02970, partial [Clostridiales bacterium]|nr:hypothetical protein [Clostridiales bacterium]
MNSVVLSVNTTQACVLAEDGSFQTVENHDYQCGEQITMADIISIKATSKKAVPVFVFSRIQKILAASILIFLLAGGLGTYAWAMPYTYLTIDSNPSIEFTANRFERVLSLRGLNEDGTTLANNLEDSVIYITLEDAVLIAVDYLYREDNSADNSENMVVTVASGNQENSENLAEQIRSTTQDTIKDFQIDATILAVSKSDFEEARKNNISPGSKLLKEKNIADSNSPRLESVGETPDTDTIYNNQMTPPAKETIVEAEDNNVPKTPASQSSQPLNPATGLAPQENISPNAQDGPTIPSSSPKPGVETNSIPETGSDINSNTESGLGTNSNAEPVQNQIQSQSPFLEPK